MTTPGVCPYCERRIGARADGRRKKHYINETSAWALLSYALLECRGSSDQGAVPNYRTISESKKRRGGKMRCLACDKWVPQTSTFRPAKHAHDGRPCKGWRDNQR
ncbi:hypothetical protein [Nocardiopsis prasina]|uniref:hypothetical protein n=1 Tax=Nocardiopsis prasina TaxID=2015 RepID=UPI0012690989|nr:hypothetical protein [Nocardiopsis prasina]